MTLPVETPLPDRIHWRGAAAVVAGAVATVAGIAAHGVWRTFPAERLLLSLVLAGLVALAAWPLRRWCRWQAATAFAAVWFVLLIVFVGPAPVASTLLLGAAAWAMGDRLVPEDAPSRAPLAIVVGLMVLAMLAGWLVMVPIHRVWTWAPLLLLLVAWRHQALRVMALDAARAWRGSVAAAPRTAASAVMLLGLASIACWVPAMQADDLAFHLALPTMLSETGAYSIDPEYQKWAFAPWAGDVLQGLVFTLSQTDAFGALNALWIAVCATLIGGPLGSALKGSITERWTAVALFATFPPLVWMAAGLQTELPATAVLLAFTALMLAEVRPGMLARAWLPASLLFSALFALKQVHAFSAFPLLLLCLWRYRHAPWSRIGLPTIAAGLLGASSYVFAWVHTGNPVLPLLNEVFASPYAPLEPYTDARWLAGFSPDLLWRMTFETSTFVEGWDGGLGFGLIALAGLWALRVSDGPGRAAILAATVVVLLPLMPMQYARYTWPGIMLLLSLLVFGSERRLGRRPFVALFVGLCVLNLGFQANASWIHHSAAVKRTIRAFGDPAAVLPHYFPERILIQDIGRGPDDILLASDPARQVTAEMGDLGRTVSPHDPSLAAEALEVNADATGERWATLIQRERIRWVLVSRPVAPAALDAGLVRLGATKVQSLNERELWRIPD
jgi:hypothetical protein